MTSNPTPHPSANSPEPQISAFDYNAWREQFILLILRVASVLGIILIITNFPTTSQGDLAIFVGLYIFLVAITALSAPYALRV